MSRDFIGTQLGRAFRQSPNRDRITRGSTPTTDWLACHMIGGRLVLLDGTPQTPTAPAGTPTEDLRQVTTREVTTVVHPPGLASASYCYGDPVVPTLPRFNIYTVTTNPNPTHLLTRIPPGPPSPFYRMTLRVWGLFPLGSLAPRTNGFVSRLGFRVTDGEFPLPDLTFYGRVPVVVFRYVSGAGPSTPAYLISVDWQAGLGGVPVNTHALTTDPLPDENYGLYDMDRIITATVRIGARDDSSVPTIIEAPIGVNDRMGAVLENTFSRAPQGFQRREHAGLIRPNGSLLNPANPFVVPNSGAHSPLNKPSVRLYEDEGEGIRFSVARIMAHMSILEPIAAYEPPTLTILRQVAV